MPAIPVHHTDTSDGAWDGPANEARLKLDQPESYYRRAYAWQDPDGDPQTKAAYRFIHHEVDSDGNIGAANLRACSTGIAVLNGGRGGTTIPEGDRRGVWRHLAAHLEDAGREAPELKAALAPDTEFRAFTLHGLQFRDADGGQPTIEGYAALFDVPTRIEDWFGEYTEVIRRGAFAKTIREADVRALLNHNPDWVLGRTKAGTLRLAEDERGLRVEILPPDTQWARDLMTSMKRGDVNQMSFAFKVIRQNWLNAGRDDEVRELLEVALYDVSVVTFPAYEQTEAYVRTAIRQLEGHLAELRRLVKAAPPPAGHPAEAEAQARLALMRARQRLAELT